jgi:hypothetical protein
MKKVTTSISILLLSNLACSSSLRADAFSTLLQHGLVEIREDQVVPNPLRLQEQYKSLLQQNNQLSSEKQKVEEKYIQLKQQKIEPVLEEKPQVVLQEQPIIRVIPEEQPLPQVISEEQERAQEEVQRLRIEIEELRRLLAEGQQGAQEEGDRLRSKIERLKLKIARLRSEAQNGGIVNEIAPVSGRFMENYVNFNNEQKSQEFDPVFIEIRDRQDVDTAYTVYNFLMNRHAELVNKIDQTPEELREAEELLAKIERMGQAPGAFAQAIERHTREQVEREIQKQIVDDEPFFQDVAQDAAARLNNNNNPPMLLLLLLKNPELIVKSNNLKKEHWRALGGYLEYLEVNQLRALRYHLQKGNNRSNIPEGEDGDAIKQFLEATTSRIDANARARPVRVFTRNSFRQYVNMINSILTPEERAQREIEADRLAYDPVVVDARGRELDINNPPMLLLFLLKDATAIVQSQDLNAIQWKRLEGFLPYLTMDQLRALRYHFQKDNNRNNIPNNEIGSAIKEFITSIGTYIERNGNPTPLDNVTKLRFQGVYPALINNIR